MRQKQSKKYNQELAQELEDSYERYRKILKDLTLMSDSFMRAVLKNPKCTEEVLRIILNKNQIRSLTSDYRQIIRICRAGRRYWTVWLWTENTIFIM